jgi:hypothetical protein
MNQRKANQGAEYQQADPYKHFAQRQTQHYLQIE